MKDANPSHEENSTATNTENGSDKATTSKASPTGKKVTPKPRSSGRGLYITAIVLGIIIVLLLVLYIFLALTKKPVTHSSIAPMPAIIQIAKS